jgi:hypothetical protein
MSIKSQKKVSGVIPPDYIKQGMEEGKGHPWVPVGNSFGHLVSCGDQHIVYMYNLVQQLVHEDKK